MSERPSLLRRLFGLFRPASEGGEAAPASAPDDLDRVAGFWADRAVERGDQLAPSGVWTSHPVVRAAINRRIGGRGDREWLAWAKDTFFPQLAARALSLGCGGGQVEREAMALGLCRAIEGVDISSGALDLARRLAAEARVDGITYRVADLSHIELPAAAYDLVIAKQSLHHVERLEHLLDETHKALVPGGRFLVNEYVGPPRFQWTELQLEIMNQLLPLLPERLRWVSSVGAARQQVERPPLEQMIAIDPSEAVRSAEILPLIEERFTVDVRRDFGGTLLNPMLEGIIANFRRDSEEDTALLRLLISIEEILTQHGVISSDFTVLVARPR
jgi:SAM-dependent methyltransferase